jgi:hypothetical protein
MIGPAEDGSDLIQQTGLDLNEAMFGALAELRDFKRGQFGLEKLEQKESGCHFEGGGTGKTATSRHIAVNVCRKSGYGNPLRNELTDDSKWVVAPAFIVLRPQVRHGNFNPASDF